MVNTKDAFSLKNASLYEEIWKGKNFSRQVGERVLKSIVKDHSQHMQQRVNAFATQCTQREFETFVYKFANADIAHNFGDNFHREANHSNSLMRTRGNMLFHSRPAITVDAVRSQLRGWTKTGSRNCMCL